MLEHAREGDIIHIHSMDRLARNLLDLKTIVSDLTDKGITIQFHKEGLTFSNNQSDAISKLILNMMGSFAEFERELIRERQREGIEQAKKAGKYKGRKPSLTGEQVQEIKFRLLNETKINKAQLAREYGISRESLYRYIRD